MEGTPPNSFFEASSTTKVRLNKYRKGKYMNREKKKRERKKERDRERGRDGQRKQGGETENYRPMSFIIG